MKYIGLLLLLFCSIGFSQEVKLKTPNSEVEDFVVWLQDQNKEDQPYLRGFSTYAVPEELRPDVVLQLSFMLHSLTGISSDKDGGAGAFYPVAIAQYKEGEKAWDKKEIKTFQSITDTLFWVDIRNFNWNFDSWEKITNFDGYMVEPIIQHESNSLLRLLSGNAVVRADWFVFHAARATEQSDKDGSNISIYRTLLYSQQKLPKTVQEFRTVWALPDLAKSRQLGNEYATLVTKSQNVARNNRMLFGYRTELGWLYQSYDVKRQQGKRDYVERFYEFGGKPPDVSDGGEIFATNQLKLQVYDLYDGKENLADFADATIVRHLSDVLGDARVSSPHSCFDCHAVGPLPSENTIAEFLKKNGGIYYKDANDKLRVERAFFSKRFEDSIKENQELYAKALLQANGLIPEDNLKSYYRVISWYAKPLDMKQASFECGVDEAALIAKSKEGLQNLNYKIPGRLALLLEIQEPIPRDIWEAENIDGIPGIFQQTMIIINGLTKITTEIVDNIPNYLGIVSEECNIYSGGTTVIKKVEAGTKVIEEMESNGGFMRVKLADGTIGWIQSENFTRKSK